MICLCFALYLHVVIVQDFSILNVGLARSRLKINPRRSWRTVKIPLPLGRWSVALATPDDDLSLDLASEEAHSCVLDSTSFVPRSSKIFLLPNSIAIWSAFHVADICAFGIVGYWRFVSMNNRFIDFWERSFGIWAILLEFFSVT